MRWTSRSSWASRCRDRPSRAGRSMRERAACRCPCGLPGSSPQLATATAFASLPADRQASRQTASLDTDRQPDAQTDRCGSHPIRDTQSQAMPRPCVHVNRAAAQLRTAAVLFRFLLACRMEADVILHAEFILALHRVRCVRVFYTPSTAGCASVLCTLSVATLELETIPCPRRAARAARCRSTCC